MQTYMYIHVPVYPSNSISSIREQMYEDSTYQRLAVSNIIIKNEERHEGCHVYSQQQTVIDIENYFNKCI